MGEGGCNNKEEVLRSPHCQLEDTPVPMATVVFTAVCVSALRLRRIEIVQLDGFSLAKCLLHTSL